MAGRNSIVKSALILTLAGLITRILGFAYRIYMSKTIGAEGMGLYQLIMPLYHLAWSISCAGITTTVSKIVAAENGKKQFGNMGRTARLAMGITGCLGFVAAGVMFFGADAISTGLLNDARTAMSIKILSIAVPFMAIGSAARGYFTGLSAMRVPATSQVLEQVVRMGAVFLLADSMLPRGLEYACAAAVIGVVAGEVAAFLYVIYSYNVDRMKWAFNHRIPDMAVKALLVSIGTMALPLTLNRVTGSILSAVENMLIPRSLQAFGMAQADAIAALGRVSGMAMPLIFFPLAFLMSLSTSIVPAVAESVAAGKTERLSATLSKAFMFTMLIGAGAASVFMALAKDLGMVIYNQDIGGMLFLLAFICPLWYINITISGVLNGLGAMTVIFRNNLISSIITILSVILAVPYMGINGFILGWFLGISLQTVLGWIRIRKEIDISFDLKGWLLKPGLAAAASGLVTKLISKNFLTPLLGQAFGLWLSVVLLIGIYLGLVILLGVMSRDDIMKAFKRITASVPKTAHD